MSDKKTLKIDEDRCIGCTLCTCICPGVYEVVETGKSRVFDQDGDTEEKIQQSIYECPVKCISNE